jgi:alpha-amylase/alpha-mannosidase (GH57 family)
MRATVNLVPSLLEQIVAYAEGRAVDPHLAVSRKRTDELSGDEALFMLEHFFSANWKTMIRPVGRYRELLEMRDVERRSAADALKRFGERDLRDLSVLFELVWFHPLLREEDQAVKELWEKGANFSEDDRRVLHERERRVIAQVVPQHKRLVESGRLEISTSPFYHPILPLLIDFACIQEALPSAPVPASARSLADDASVHVSNALTFCENVLGVRPRGMWPSEGAVSQEAVAMMAARGVQWLVTDEQILERSAGQAVGRKGEALARPDMLYRPYEMALGDATVSMVFRDHYLSDLIGFRYRSWEGASAAYDLLGRLRAIGESWRKPFAPIVTVVLDGENAWEHYPNHGIEFLTTLYRGLASANDEVTPVTVSEAIAASEAGTLERVFAGSWIDHSFQIWGGHGEDRAAWDLVYQCRDALDDAGIEEGHEAREELRIAQGSDWYWWYGDDHACANDAEFDRLFRGHVRAAYEKAGLPVPGSVDESITHCREGQAVAKPTRLITPTIDGDVTHYYEWLGAGRVRGGGPLGVMDVPRDQAVKTVRFGCDTDRLYVRVDFHSGAPAARGQESMRVTVQRPHACAFFVPLDHESDEVESEDGAVGAGATAFGRILEVAIPWEALGARPGDRVVFVVERLEDGRAVERTPGEGEMELEVPSEDDVNWDWSAE